MKLNQSLTAAITAAALVVGAGFAYAQSTTPGAPGDVNAQGDTTMKAPVTPDTSTSTTLQAQPATGAGTSADTSNSSTMQSGTVMPEPRADRN